MKTRITSFLLAALLSFAFAPELSAQGNDSPLTGDKAIEHLKSTGRYESLRAAITGARYGVRTSPARDFTAMAANPAHGLFSTFTSEGLRMRVRTGTTAGAPVYTVTWRLESLGYGAAQLPVPAGTLKTEGTRVELARAIPRLTEWFQNTPTGLEHGFTLAERPSANPQGEPLRLVMAVTGDLAPQADATGQSLRLCDAAGRTVVSYDKLKVWDATGAELPATMETSAGCVTLTVSEAAARYPLTIDPTIIQQAYLKASNTGANDSFGTSVAVSGDTVVVGAHFEDSNGTGVNGVGTDPDINFNSGAAYVFVRSGTTWRLQAYLKAHNTGGAGPGQSGDQFGTSVAVSGDTVVVGAPGEDANAAGVNNVAPGAGAAYVFVRNPLTGVWLQQAYLKASIAEFGDYFGYSVAVSGDTVVVGARFENSNATGVNGDQSNNSADNAGAAYVFVRNGTTWSQQAYLKASNTDAGDHFGTSVAALNDMAVIGAPLESSNATGVNDNGSNNTATNSGAAYVFVRSGTNWSQQVYLKASNTGLGDQFGASVAASGAVVVGAPGEDSNATGVNGDGSNNSASFAGAAYVFVRNALTGIWGQRAYLKASNTDPLDVFGSAVAVSGNTVVVGAPMEVIGGAAYVFVRGGTIVNPTWTQQAYLKASNSEGNDFFGMSVAVSGDTVVVGAYGEASNATTVNGDQTNNSAGASGAAYVIVFCDPAANPIQLSIGTQGTDLKLAWPVTCTTDTLEETTDLTNPASWTTVAVPPTNNGTQYEVIVPISGDIHFYRVRRQ